MKTKLNDNFFPIVNVTMALLQFDVKVISANDVHSSRSCDLTPCDLCIPCSYVKSKVYAIQEQLINWTDRMHI